jgi:hypothetical protein
MRKCRTPEAFHYCVILVIQVAIGCQWRAQQAISSYVGNIMLARDYSTKIVVSSTECNKGRRFAIEVLYVPPILSYRNRISWRAYILSLGVSSISCVYARRYVLWKCVDAYLVEAQFQLFELFTEHVHA